MEEIFLFTINTSLAKGVAPLNERDQFPAFTFSWLICFYTSCIMKRNCFATVHRSIKNWMQKKCFITSGGCGINIMSSYFTCVGDIICSAAQHCLIGHIKPYTYSGPGNYKLTHITQRHYKPSSTGRGSIKPRPRPRLSHLDPWTLGYRGLRGGVLPGEARDEGRDHVGPCSYGSEYCHFGF